MTAKEYLKQAFRLNERIDANLAELGRLREMASSVRSPDMSKDKVQGGGAVDQVGNIVTKIADLDAKVNAEIDRLIDLKSEIRTVIGDVDDNTLRLILQKRYLVFERWEKIAVDLNYDYRWVTRLHSKALQHVRVPGS